MDRPEANKALIRRFYREIDAGNLEAMDELVAEDYLNHDPAPFPGLSPGRAGLKQAFKMFAEATPGIHEVLDQVAEGDKVVTRLRATGIHQGSLAGMPASGNAMDVKAIAIHRIRAGKIVEHWGTTDSATMLAQLGAIRLPGAPPQKPPSAGKAR